jgi:hypothetical protein
VRDFVALDSGYQLARTYIRLFRINQKGLCLAGDESPILAVSLITLDIQTGLKRFTSMAPNGNLNQRRKSGIKRPTRIIMSLKSRLEDKGDEKRATHYQCIQLRKWVLYVEHRLINW